MITYQELTIEMFESLVEGWRLLPDHATGLGDDRESITGYLERNKGCSFAAFHDGKLIGPVL
jgi:hypothetical protein